MSALRGGRTALAAVCAAAALALGGCSFSLGTSLDQGADAADEPDRTVEDLTDDLADDAGVPEECLAVSIASFPGADLADVAALPADWPEPPAGSILCATSDGGTTETAAYAASVAFDRVVAHYESSLPAAYETVRLSGEENGTGYASLDGVGPGVGFQIRENDGGFTLVFAAGGA